MLKGKLYWKSHWNNGTSRSTLRSSWVPSFQDF